MCGARTGKRSYCPINTEWSTHWLFSVISKAQDSKDIFNFQTKKALFLHHDSTLETSSYFFWTVEDGEGPENPFHIKLHVVMTKDDFVAAHQHSLEHEACISSK